MRKILPVLFLLTLPLLLLGQLEGKYCSVQRDYVYSRSCITFLNNSRFEYEYVTSMHRVEGHGEYRILGNILVLTFLLDLPTDGGYEFIVNQEDSQSDTIEINISAMNAEDGDTLTYANVLLRDEAGKILRAGNINELGNCQFRFPRSTEPYYLELTYLTYTQKIGPISADKSYQLTSRMRLKKFPTDGQILTCKIKKKYSHSIVMKEIYPRARFQVFERE